MAEIGPGIGMPAAKVARPNLNTSSTRQGQWRSRTLISVAANDPRSYRAGTSGWRSCRRGGPIGRPACRGYEGSTPEIYGWRLIVAPIYLAA